MFLAFQKLFLLSVTFVTCLLFIYLAQALSGGDDIQVHVQGHRVLNRKVFLTWSYADIHYGATIGDGYWAHTAWLEDIRFVRAYPQYIFPDDEEDLTTRITREQDLIGIGFRHPLPVAHLSELSFEV